TKGGSVWEAALADLAEDALTGVALLKTRKEINPGKIGVLGHSEGALVAALAAAKRKDVAFVILLGAPGRAGDKLIDHVLRKYWADIGVADTRVPEFREILDRIHKIVRAEKDRA